MLRGLLCVQAAHTENVGDAYCQICFVTILIGESTMNSKIVLTTLLLSGLGLVFSATADARGRGNCGCCSNSGTTYTETAQAADGQRVYSYQPSSGYYMGRGTSSRPSTPLYLVPKSDSRKYDAR